MIKRVALRTIAVSVMAGAVALLTAAPASATRVERDYGQEQITGVSIPAPIAQGNYPNGGGGFGTGGFEPDGEIFYVQDIRRDAGRVAIHWRLGNDQRRGLCINKLGAAYIVRCNKDFDEGRTIQFRIGVCDNGSDAACNELREWDHWSGWLSTRS